MEHEKLYFSFVPSTILEFKFFLWGKARLFKTGLDIILGFPECFRHYLFEAHGRLSNGPQRPVAARSCSIDRRGRRFGRLIRCFQERGLVIHLSRRTNFVGNWCNLKEKEESRKGKIKIKIDKCKHIFYHARVDAVGEADVRGIHASISLASSWCRRPRFRVSDEVLVSP